jgi:hypothetical protein
MITICMNEFKIFGMMMTMMMIREIFRIAIVQLIIESLSMIDF